MPFEIGPDPLAMPPQSDVAFVTSGTLASGASAAIQVQGAPGQGMRVEASGFDTLIEVTAADGSVLATDDDGLGDGLGGSAATFGMPADGMATVTVRGVGDASGDYRVVIASVSREAGLPEGPSA